MAAAVRTFLKDARTKPVSRKGVIVAVYGAMTFVSLVLVLVEAFVGGGWLGDGLQRLAFFTCFTLMLINGGGLWKEQTQASADRRV
jgi:hypothetical protein